VKFTIKTFALALLVSGAIAIPASAETITWTFDDTTASSHGNAGILLSDNSRLTGTFNYACSTSNGGTCDGVGNTGPNPGLGTFSPNPTGISVSGGSIIGAGQTWYLLQNADDSASDNQSIFLVNFDPNYALSGSGSCDTGGGCATNGMTAGAGGTPGYLIALSISNGIGGVGGMDDSGGVYLLNNGAPPQGGYCDNAECSVVNSGAGPYGAVGLTTESDQTGHIWAPAYVPPPPISGTPEPATMALAGSALLALGFARRKFSAKK